MQQTITAKSLGVLRSRWSPKALAPGMQTQEALQALERAHVDGLDVQACDALLRLTLDLQRRLQARLQHLHSFSSFLLLVEALRVILPICNHYSPYYGGDGSSTNNALALALTCKAFRDEVFNHFPRREDGKRFTTHLQVQSVSRLRWARALGGPWNEHVCDAAAEQDMLGVLQFAVTHGCPWVQGGICELAVPQEDQSIEMLRWMISQGAVITSDAVATAAHAGRLDAMQLMLKVHLENLDEYEDPDLLDEFTCFYAANGGQLEVLQWLKLEADCPWDANTCTEAASGGHLRMLKWAHESGCPWDAMTRRRAAQRVAHARVRSKPPDEINNALACLRYVIHHGCPRPATNCYVCAAPPPRSSQSKTACCRECERITHPRGSRGPGCPTFTPFRWLPTDLP